MILGILPVVIGYAMPASRREFIGLAAGATAGSVLLAGCNGVDVQPQSTAGVSGAGTKPTPMPHAVAVDAVMTSSTVEQLQTFLQSNASTTFAMPAIASVIPTIGWAGLLSGAETVATSLPDGIILAASDPVISGPIRNQFTASLVGNPAISGYPCLAVNRLYTCKGQSRATASVNVLRFMTNAKVFELAGAVGDGSPSGVVTTLIVDGQLVLPKVLSAGRLNGGGWDFGSIRIDFGSRAIRDIWVVTDLFVA